MVFYRSLFLSVLLFNCQAWSKITTNNIHKLRTVQLKYLKRSMHIPTSTTDVICYRELGVLPIEYEIDIRRLTFPHHIVTLDEHDPVRVVYQQQSRLEYEENRHNDIKERLERYNIGESEEEIKDMKKEKWKRLVKGKVEDYAVEQINIECNEKKKTNLFTIYKEFNIEPYLVKMQPGLARTIFSIRSSWSSRYENI